MGDYIKKRKKELGYDRKQFLKICELGHATIERMESKTTINKVWHPASLILMANALEISVEELSEKVEEQFQILKWTETLDTTEVVVGNFNENQWQG